MSATTPFTPQTYTILLSTNSTASTANSTSLTSANLHGPASNYQPTQVRIVNTGTTIVFVSFTPATATIAAPTAGAGNGTQSIALMPGVVEVFTIPQCPSLWVNDISAAASQNYYMVFGEGP